MYLLGVLCLVSFTAALPFSEPHVEDVDVAANEPALHTDEAALEIAAQKGEQEEKNDEDRAEPPAELTITPPHPIKPPHREVIIELHKVDRYSEREDDPRDKLIRRDLNLSAFIGSVFSVISNAVMYGLPAILGIIQNLPLLNHITRSSPSRIVVVDDVQ